MCHCVNSILSLESVILTGDRNNEKNIKRSSKSGTTATTSESNEEKSDDLNLSNETETAKVKMKLFATRRQASDSNLLKKVKYLEFSR